MSFLWTWVMDLMSFFGLGSKDAKILFLGLDNAGKTTLLHMLKSDKVHAPEPTFQPGGLEELQVANLNIKAFDLGGHHAARQLWSTYFPSVNAIIYLVDAVDRERFPESKAALDSLLSNEALSTTPILILANKVDMATAATEPEIRAHLGIAETTGKTVKSIPADSGIRPIEVFMCSIINKFGYPEGIKWLANFV